MIKLKNKFLRDMKGTILPAAALLVAVIIPLCGLTVDVSYMGILRGSLDRATEAAAVAGANEYFRSMANGGNAINEVMRVFEMNVTDNTMIGRVCPSTGASSSYSHTETFNGQVNGHDIFRGQPITVTGKAELNRGRITVTSEVTPLPFFTQLFSAPTPITITKTAELPPYDISFVFDLSGSMRFATVMTYVGNAWRENIRTMATVFLPEVILYQSQNQNWNAGSMITANGYNVTISSITDVLINTPGTDIGTNTTYENGRAIYINDPKRGFITNTQNSNGLRRTELSGFTITEARLASNELMGLTQTFDENRNLPGRQFRDYFNRAAAYIEPHASATYGVMAFIDTVRIYGTAQLNLALVTFQSDSFTNDYSQNWWAPELMRLGLARNIRDTYPYVMLVEPNQFNSIYNALEIMHQGGGFFGATMVNSYPNGGTNISAGLDNAWDTFERSGRRNRNPQRVVILFTDGDPTGADSYNRLGRTVKRLTDQGVTVYSIVLTLAVGPGTINSFRNAVENVGGAEPVIFISDPAQIDEAFINIANDLGLKLVN